MYKLLNIKGTVTTNGVIKLLLLLLFLPHLFSLLQYYKQMYPQLHLLHIDALRGLLQLGILRNVYMKYPILVLGLNVVLFSIYR